MVKVIRPADEKKLAGSRDFGIVVRTRIESQLEQSLHAIVDLTGLEDMSPSFADECFGKLWSRSAKTYGSEPSNCGAASRSRSCWTG